ncbi:hypothetical protein FA15DRAFT_754717, partial [Coprinopsis marcescibilis]
VCWKVSRIRSKSPHPLLQYLTVLPQSPSYPTNPKHTRCSTLPKNHHELLHPCHLHRCRCCFVRICGSSCTYPRASGRTRTGCCC